MISKPDYSRIDEWAELLDEDILNLLRGSGQHVNTTLEDLGWELQGLEARRVLLVVDRTAVSASGLGSLIEESLSDCNVVEFDSFSPNPDYMEAVHAARTANEHRADVVVGIGGGSCLDVAKVAALCAPHPDRVEDLARGKELFGANPLPVVAIPTTSGTGSEATHFAAIYVDGRKVSVANQRIRPKVVFLDTRLHQCMPQPLAAVSGLDALGQAFESLWAVDSTKESLGYSRAACRVITRHLEESVVNASPTARFGMMVGAYLAGLAINISKTTAAHALSYQLTKRFGLAHGHAVALTLGYIGAANASTNASNCLDPRGVDHVMAQTALAAEYLRVHPMKLPEAIHALMSRFCLAASLQEAGVPEESLTGLAESVDPVRLGNNPRRLETEDILSLLEAAHDSTNSVSFGDD